MNLHTTRRGTRRWSDAGRGLVAALGVLLLAVGVPAGLIAWVGWPLPSEVPSLEEIGDALRDSYVPDEFLIKALAVVCWLVWVELMVALVVEAVAYAGGRQAGRLPLTASGMQRAAARLVATAALLGALAATRSAPEIATRALSPPPADLVVAQQVAAQPAEADDGVDTAGRPAPVDHPLYQVQPRDTLWRIAECHLGDPFRWTEIYELNRGVPQPDGRVLHDADLIHPGWQLRLPADATGLGTPAGAGAGPSATTHASAPATPAPPPALPAGAGGEDPGAMVLLDEDDLTGGAPSGGSGGELVAPDGRSGGNGSTSRTGRAGRVEGHGSPDAGAGSAEPSGPTGGSGPAGSVGGPGGAGTADPVAPTPLAGASPASATPTPTSGPDDAGGMVLLPDTELAPTESPSGDDWLVARGDE